MRPEATVVLPAHEVGDLDERPGGVAARDDDMLETGPGLQGLDHLPRVHPAELHRVGELVEEEHVVGLVCETPLDLLPPLTCLVRALGEVSTRPRPAVTHLEPV